MNDLACNLGSNLSAGELARHAGCGTETLRYYERLGLLPPPPRSPGGHRRYGRAELERLRFIRACRKLEFPLETVRSLLALDDRPQAPCAEVRALAVAQAEEVRRRIAALQRLEASLTGLAARCRPGRRPDCPILGALHAGAGAGQSAAR